MMLRGTGSWLQALGILCALLILAANPARLAKAQPIPPEAHTSEQETPPAGTGRLYFFRGIRAFGAHIEDYVTLNGRPVAKISPGRGFYCDVQPGSYVISILRHKTFPATVPVAAGQKQYVYISVRETGGTAPRGGAGGMDMSFEVRLLEPAYGARRASEYSPLTQANCTP